MNNRTRGTLVRNLRYEDVIKIGDAYIAYIKDDHGNKKMVINAPKDIKIEHIKNKTMSELLEESPK